MRCFAAREAKVKYPGRIRLPCDIERRGLARKEELAAGIYVLLLGRFVLPRRNSGEKRFRSLLAARRGAVQA